MDRRSHGPVGGAENDDDAAEDRLPAGLAVAEVLVDVPQTLLEFLAELVDVIPPGGIAALPEEANEQQPFLGRFQALVDLLLFLRDDVLDRTFKPPIRASVIKLTSKVPNISSIHLLAPGKYTQWSCSYLFKV